MAVVVDLCASDDEAGGSARATPCSAEPRVTAFRDATSVTSIVLTDAVIASFIAHCSGNVNVAVGRFLDVGASGVACSEYVWQEVTDWNCALASSRSASATSL